MTTSIESPLNLVRGPAKMPEWAQLIRLGGDRVAILFEELRNVVGRVDGIVERLHYLSNEGRWCFQYCVADAELFTVRISPGLLETATSLSRLDAEILLRSYNLSGTIKDAIRRAQGEAGLNVLRLPLTDRRRVQSFANLVKAKCRLVSSAAKPLAEASACSESEMQ